nr:uncharacterized protein LOC104111582 isoform X2 [Nicotiana tomentosiformis]
MEEVNEFTIEEGLHQAVVVKFSYGKPELQVLRQIIPKQFDVKGSCNIGLLEFRHVLVKFDLLEDYVQFLSRYTSYVKSNGGEFFFRTFPWTIGFNLREETSKAVVWISFPMLSPNLFAKKSLLSISSAVGKPLAVVKATHDRTRPSTARIKVLLDLLERHPKRVKIHIVDKSSGKSVEHKQEVVHDNLSRYCTYCKHQGHDERLCHLMNGKTKEDDAVARQKSAGHDDFLSAIETSSVEQLKGDARDFLNAKRAGKIVEEGLVEDNAGKQQQMLNLQTEGVQQTVIVNEGVVVGVPKASVQVDTRNNSRRHNGQQGDGKQTVITDGFGNHRTTATVPLNRAIARFTGEMSIAVARGTQDVDSTLHTTAMVDATGVTEGPGAGQKYDGAGHQTSNGKGQINVQKATDGKEKGAEQVALGALKHSVTLNSSVGPANDHVIDRGSSRGEEGDNVQLFEMEKIAGQIREAEANKQGITHDGQATKAGAQNNAAAIVEGSARTSVLKYATAESPRDTKI